MALGTTLNTLSIRSLGIEQYGFVNESDGGDDLLSRKLAVIDGESLNCNKAHICLGKHGFNSTLDSGEDECYERMSKTLKKNGCCDNEAYCSFLYPYETDNEASSFISSYYQYETDHEAYSFFLYPYETDHEADSFLSSYYPRETREALGLESYGFISTPDPLIMKTLSVRSLGLEEYGFIDED